MTTFDVSNLQVDRSGISVVGGINLVARSGEITVLLGANGAGKTTLLEGLSGIIPCTSGDIRLNDTSLFGAYAGKRTEAGLRHVEQGRTVFSEMTTEENLVVALRHNASIDEAYTLFPELLERRHIKSGMLSGGEQQMLVIARALVGRPKVIMIDEMSAGLAPIIVNRLMAAVRKMADSGAAVILVEQFAMLALGIGNRAYVMRRGKIVYEGSCDGLRSNPSKLHHLYLGDNELLPVG